MLPEIKKMKTSDGEELHLEIIENGSPVWIIVSHGVGEHCGRHSYFYEIFSQYFNICTYDLRGHGKSTGKRGHAESFQKFVLDLEDIKSYLKSTYSLNRYVLFGHSMGALVVSSYMQNLCSKNGSEYPEKVFLSSPPVAAAGPLGKIFDLMPMSAMKALKNLPISAPVGGLVDLSRLSHDPRVREEYINDERNVLKVHTKLLLEVLNEARNVFSRPLRISCDLYCAIGTEDGVVNPKAIERYFSLFEKNAKVLKVEGGYHELHNEIDRYQAPYIEFLKQSLMDTIYKS